MIINQIKSNQIKSNQIISYQIISNQIKSNQCKTMQYDALLAKSYNTMQCNATDDIHPIVEKKHVKNN